MSSAHVRPAGDIDDGEVVGYALDNAAIGGLVAVRRDTTNAPTISLFVAARPIQIGQLVTLDDIGWRSKVAGWLHRVASRIDR